MRITKLLLLAIFFLLMAISFKKIQAVVLKVIILSNLILFIYSILLGLNPVSSTYLTQNEYLSKQEVNKLYSFSKDSNVIVILLDGFQGNLLYDVLDKYPILKQQLSGFVYYPNTLSYSPATDTSMGAIIGGEKYKLQYRPFKSSMLALPKDILSYHKGAFLHAIKIAKKYKHSYSTYGPHVSCDIFKIYKDSFCTHKVFWTKEEKYKNKQFTNPSNIYLDIVTHLYKMSFILSVPHVIKSKLTNILHNHTILFDGSQNEHQQLNNMNDFANTNSKKKTFKFIHNKITHPPQLTNIDCEVEYVRFKGYDGHFNPAYCALKRLVPFFKTLDKLGIYDKTKIIIMSDHGHGTNTKKVKNISHSWANALMLVKDFNASSDLKISDTFLSNSDTYGIALSGISENKEIILDPIKTINKNRSLFYTEYDDYKLKKIFEVKYNIYKKENWKELNTQEIKEMSNFKP